MSSGLADRSGLCTVSWQETVASVRDRRLRRSADHGEVKVGICADDKRRMR